MIRITLQTPLSRQIAGAVEQGAHDQLGLRVLALYLRHIPASRLRCKSVGHGRIICFAEAGVKLYVLGSYNFYQLLEKGQCELGAAGSEQPGGD